MKFDFSFDERIAKRYTEQRAHPPAIAAQIGSAIAQEIGTGKKLLEIGIGNGRIGLPVAAAGCQVVGMDLSANMLAEASTLRTESGLPKAAAKALQLYQADMHQLPMAANVVDAVLTVHVLHLATDWQQVIAEGTRVLRSGGLFIQGEDWVDPQSVFGRLRDELRNRAIALNPGMKPPAAGISKESALAGHGGTDFSEKVVAEWTTWLSPQERLEMIENRMDNESWFLPQPVFDLLIPQLHQYAAETWSDLSEKQPVKRRFQLKIARGAW